MDSHVKAVATAEVGRRTHLLRRGLEQEKTATQSRFEKTQVQIFKIGQESVNNISDLSARVEILDNKHDIIKHEMFDSLKKTQSDIKSEMKQAFEKNRAQIATVQQEVLTTQRNAQSLQSRDDTFERTLSDLKSKTSTIAAQMDTTRGQISRLQHVTGTFVGFSVRLNTEYSYYNKDTVIKFDEVFYNEGGHYSTSTGIFTVPVSGVYVFMFNVQSYSNDKNRLAHVLLYVNGDLKMEAIAQGIDVNLTGGNAAVVNVLAGDRVYVSTSKLHERHYIYLGRTSFSGALLHVI